MQEYGARFLRGQPIDRKQLDDVMPSDDDSEWAQKKRTIVSGEEPPKRRYRTVIDGVKNLPIKRSKDIWQNKRISTFIDSNTSEGKRIAY